MMIIREERVELFQVELKLLTAPALECLPGLLCLR